MKENHLIINKTARYFTLGELSENTRSVCFLLHGHGHNAKNFLAAFKPLWNESKLFIAPEGLNRYYLRGFSGNVGVTWMTREDRLNEIKDYVHYLDDLYEFLGLEKFTGSITALGFSQGASTVTRWVEATGYRVDNVIVYAGEVAPELLPLTEHSNLRKTKNYFIYGTKDEFVTPEVLDRLKSNYQTMNFTEISFEGGHEVRIATLAHLL